MEDLYIVAVEAWKLFEQHAWIPLAALVVGALVRMLKAGALADKIPPRARPWIALGLGLVSGVLEAIVAGTPIATAIAGGLISGALAIAGHDTIIESARKGKEVGMPASPPLALLLLVGCVPPKPPTAAQACAAATELALARELERCEADYDAAKTEAETEEVAIRCDLLDLAAAEAEAGGAERLCSAVAK